MKICAIQMDVRLGELEANRVIAAEMMAEAMERSPDVLVLPELWDLGFYPKNVMELADEDGRVARAFLSGYARRFGVNIVGGSIARRQGNSLWNTTYVFNRQGELQAAYDKIHLFSMGGEDRFFQNGRTFSLYELDGVLCASLTCYELRFWEYIYSLSLSGAMVVFAPASWPVERLEQWRLLVRARAMEGQCFIMGVSATGGTSRVRLCGHSLLADPRGGIVAEAGGTQQLLHGVCDCSGISELRDSFNAYKDRRPDLYRLPGER